MPERQFSATLSVGLPKDLFASILVRKDVGEAATVTVLVYLTTSLVLATGHWRPPFSLVHCVVGDCLVGRGFDLFIPEGEREALQSFLAACDRALAEGLAGLPRPIQQEVSRVH